MYCAGSWCDALDDGDEPRLGRSVPCVRVRDEWTRSVDGSIMGLAYALHGQQPVSCTDPAVNRSWSERCTQLASRRVDASEQPDG